MQKEIMEIQRTMRDFRNGLTGMTTSAIPPAPLPNTLDEHATDLEFWITDIQKYIEKRQIPMEMEMEEIDQFLHPNWRWWLQNKIEKRDPKQPMYADEFFSLLRQNVLYQSETAVIRALKKVTWKGDVLEYLNQVRAITAKHRQEDIMQEYGVPGKQNHYRSGERYSTATESQPEMTTALAAVNMMTPVKTEERETTVSRRDVRELSPLEVEAIWDSRPMPTGGTAYFIATKELHCPLKIRHLKTERSAQKLKQRIAMYQGRTLHDAARALNIPIETTLPILQSTA
ncbi:MAG: hypothetical protein ACRC28_09370, partial [Clostridium sp.]|uniref:hypothetical protein n=1 Tax=Clostridium sp. TaxID=1506 RepID=UPI003F3EE62D